MNPFGVRQTLIELAVAILIVALCLHYAAVLIAAVWKTLVIIGIAVLSLWLLWIVWRLIRGRRQW